MNPRRLVDVEPQKSVRAQLLRAGLAMEPPTSTVQKTLLGLGVAGTTLGATKVVGAAVGASGATSFLSSALIKWIAIGFVGGSTMLGVAHVSGVWRSHPTAAAMVPQHREAALSTAGPRHAKQTEGPAPSASSDIAPAEAHPPSSLEPPSNEATPRTMPIRPARLQIASSAASGDRDQPLAREPLISQSPLAAEVALVDQIRQAVERREPARAFEFIEQHRRRFTSPRLGEEVAFFRARALELAGRRSEAERALEEFKANYPASPLTERR